MAHHYHIHHVHTQNSIQALLKYQAELTSPTTYILGYAICSVLLIVGVKINQINMPASILLMMGACWALVAISSTPNRKARKVTEYYGDKGLPIIDYDFTDKEVSADFHSQVDHISYRNIKRILEDRNYCYLYLQSGSVYVFNKRGEEDIDSIKTLLAEKTQLKWTSKKPLNLALTSFLPFLR